MSIFMKKQLIIRIIALVATLQVCADGVTNITNKSNYSLMVNDSLEIAPGQTNVLDYPYGCTTFKVKVASGEWADYHFYSGCPSSLTCNVTAAKSGQLILKCS